MKRKYKFGTSNINNNLINVQGPKHEQGGVDIGNNVEVEGEEAVYDNFVFSHRLMHKDGKTFADKAKKIENKYKKDNSTLANKTKEKELARLAQEQESIKQEMIESEMANTMSQGDPQAPAGMPAAPMPMEGGGAPQPQAMAYGGKIGGGEKTDSTKTNNEAALAEYEKMKSHVEKARQAIGKNDKKTLRELGLGKPYSSNDLSRDFSQLQKLRQKAGLGTAEEASILFPHVGQQIRGGFNQAMGTNFAYGGKLPKKKMFLGGAIASGVGSLINIGRGAFEEARQYDPIELERAEANTIDLGEQRTSAALTSERGRTATNQTIRNNAGSSGQLLGNTLVNNARTTDDLNRVTAESFMNEENVNANILNQNEQFNTQIGNQETMQNFQIEMMNDANKDAKRELMFQGIGDLVGAAGNFSTDMFKMNRDRESLAALTDLSPEQQAAIFGNTNSFSGMLGFGRGNQGGGNTNQAGNDWYNSLNKYQKAWLSKRGNPVR